MASCIGPTAGVLCLCMHNFQTHSQLCWLWVSSKEETAALPVRNGPSSGAQDVTSDPNIQTNAVLCLQPTVDYRNVYGV